MTSRESVIPFPPLSRRDLLKLAGAATGAMTLGPLMVRLSGSAAAESLTVGVLLPESSLYPRLAANLLAGLSLALAQAKQPIRLLPVEYGVRPSAAAEAARRLILDQGARLLVGTLSQPAISQIQPLLNERATPLIATTAGANLLRHEPSPYIFHNTLGAWQAAYAAGTWAAANLGRRAVTAASFYESGYDTLGAFVSGFEAAGGTVVAGHVSHMPTDNGGLAPLMRAMTQSRPDLVYAAYSGEAGAEFLRAYADSGLAGRVPLVGSAFLAASPPPAGISLYSPLSWSAGLDKPANSAFQSAFATANGRSADAFAALGYDTGLLIAQAIDSSHFRGDNGLATTLPNSSVDGPRGPVTISRANHAAESSLYLRAISSRASQPHEQIAAALALPDSSAATALKAGLKTGWLNAYLCV